MSIRINVEQMVWRASTIEVTDRQLDVMVAQGVDVTDEIDVGEFYRKHVGEEIDGVYFQSLSDIADEWNSADDRLNDVIEWWAEGEAPDEYWPDEESEGGTGQETP